MTRGGVQLIVSVCHSLLMPPTQITFNSNGNVQNMEIDGRIQVCVCQTTLHNQPSTFPPVQHSCSSGRPHILLASCTLSVLVLSACVYPNPSLHRVAPRLSAPPLIC